MEQNNNQNPKTGSNSPERRKRVTTPIHFYEPGKEWRRQAIHIHEPGEEWRRNPIYFYDPEEEIEIEADLEVLSDEVEEKTGEQIIAQISSDMISEERGIHNETAASVEEDAKAKLESKTPDASGGSVSASAETGDRCIEKMHMGQMEETTGAYFSGTHIRNNSQVNEIRVPSANAKAVFLDGEIAEKIFGCSAYELLQGDEAEKRIKNLIESREGKPEKRESSNFSVIPIKKIRYVDRDGRKKGDEKIICHIWIQENVYQMDEGEFEIRVTEIDDLVKIIQKEFPSAIILESGRKNQIRNDFRKKLSNIGLELHYTDAGWNRIKGVYTYIHKGMSGKDIIADTELNLPVDERIRPCDIPMLFEQILRLYVETKTLYVMITYSFLGVLYKAFAEAGYPPHFLLFMEGHTGSMKTSIAKVLYAQLCDDRYRKFPRRIDADSEASLERGLILSGQDTVTLLDDYAPAKTPQKANEMKNKLEMIIRIVGDGSTKSRSNASLEDCRGEGLKGMVVITGELKETGQSSSLRCLHCEIKKEYVNTDILSMLQSDERIFTTVLHHMTVFVAGQWDILVGYIKDHYEIYRRQAEQKLHTGRMVDTITTLWLVTDIMDQFLKIYCSSICLTDRIEDIKKELLSLVMDNEEDAMDDDPAEVFMRGLATMVNNNQLEVVTYDRRGELLNKADGYKTEEHYYMLPERCYKGVKDWLLRSGKEFTLDISSTVKMIHNSGYIQASSNGSDKKTYYSRIRIGEKRIRLLKIPKDAIEKILEKDKL